MKIIRSLVASILLAACNSGGGGNPSPPTPTTNNSASKDKTSTPSPTPLTGYKNLLSDWTGYCIATFNADYEVKDYLGKVVKTVKATEQFLIGTWSFSISSPMIDIIDLTPAGPISFRTEQSAMTSNCNKQTAKSALVAFYDVTLFSDPKAESTKVCTVAGGTFISSGGGFEGTDFNSQTDYSIYKFTGPEDLPACKSSSMLYGRVAKRKSYSQPDIMGPIGFLSQPN